MTLVLRIHATQMQFVTQAQLTVPTLVPAPPDTKVSIVLKTLMNANKGHRVNTMDYVLTHPVVFHVIVLKVLLDLAVKQTSTNVNPTHAKMTDHVWMTQELLFVFVCQDTLELNVKSILMNVKEILA